MECDGQFLLVVIGHFSFVPFLWQCLPRSLYPCFFFLFLLIIHFLYFISSFPFNFGPAVGHHHPCICLMQVGLATCRRGFARLLWCWGTEPFRISVLLYDKKWCVSQGDVPCLCLSALTPRRFERPAVSVRAARQTCVSGNGQTRTPGSKAPNRRASIRDVSPPNVPSIFRFPVSPQFTGSRGANVGNAAPALASGTAGDAASPLGVEPKSARPWALAPVLSALSGDRGRAHRPRGATGPTS